MQTTLAFAPTPEDLDEVYFDAPIMTLVPSAPEEEESEQGEP
jgi:hypothetical protein